MANIVPDDRTAERVFQLTIERKEMMDKKKAATKAYNEEIKRIEAEINDLLENKEKQLEKIEDDLDDFAED